MASESVSDLYYVQILIPIHLQHLGRCIHRFISTMSVYFITVLVGLLPERLIFILRHLSRGFLNHLV